MFENKMWLSGTAAEDITNKSFCIYNNHDNSITNIKDVNEISTNVFVFVYTVISKDKKIETPEIIKKGEMARCLRVHISV